jgi:hypothetical protein
MPATHPGPAGDGFVRTASGVLVPSGIDPFHRA